MRATIRFSHTTTRYRFALALFFLLLNSFSIPIRVPPFSVSPSFRLRFIRHAKFVARQINSPVRAYELTAVQGDRSRPAFPRFPLRSAPLSTAVLPLFLTFFRRVKMSLRARTHSPAAAFSLSRLRFPTCNKARQSCITDCLSAYHCYQKLHARAFLQVKEIRGLLKNMKRQAFFIAVHYCFLSFLPI